MKFSEKKVKKHSSARKKVLKTRLLSWYDVNARHMPWRAVKPDRPDPYRVWLSEIMLQQTTVATVRPYYLKFIRRWPTLKDLASASLDDILRMWAGLGYYRRARLLHKCARMLVKSFGTTFPADERMLLELPGFGPYTAAAVAAIAFDLPANVVDGNVERVMSRMFMVEEPLPKAKPVLRAVTASLVPSSRCGDYAQALMDLGATVCRPRAPKCPLCPWRDFCAAYAEGIQETLPRREKKKSKPLRRAYAFVLFNSKGEVLLRRRPSEGLLAGMMEVPTTPWKTGPMPTVEEAEICAPEKVDWRPISGIVRHVFTHFSLELVVLTAVTEKKLKGLWTSSRTFQGEALPSVMKKVLSHAMRHLAIDAEENCQKSGEPL